MAEHDSQKFKRYGKNEIETDADGHGKWINIERDPASGEVCITVDSEFVSVAAWLSTEGVQQLRDFLATQDGEQ